MRNLILMLTILFTGIVSAQTYGPVNGATFTVTGTSLGIAGSISSDGEFGVVNSDFTNSLLPYAEESFGGSFSSTGTINSIVVTADQYRVIDESLDPTIEFIRNGEVFDAREGDSFDPTTNTIGFDTGVDLMPGDTWRILVYVECLNGLSPHEDLDAAITATGLGFYSAGFTAWINQVGAETRWTRIEIDGTNFVLETNAGSEGHIGTRTSYDCLEDLLAAL